MNDAPREQLHDIADRIDLETASCPAPGMTARLQSMARQLRTIAEALPLPPTEVLVICGICSSRYVYHPDDPHCPHCGKVTGNVPDN